MRDHRCSAPTRQLRGVIGFGVLILASISLLPVASGQIAPPARVVEVGKGWSRNSINAVVFRRNSVVTHESTQFVAYYSTNGRVTLAKRKLGSLQWEIRETKLIGDTADAHNSISIMVDGKGYLHLAWNHHGDPLQYSRSLSPDSFEMSGVQPMIGRTESRVTYPEFHRFPNGDLLFLYRDGESGRGNLVMNLYESDSGKWSRIQDVLLDGEGARNAYWQAIIDRAGTIHLSWVWRETGDVSTNHDLCYARSNDRGLTWERTTGEPYKLPINSKNAEYARRIPQGSELINQTSMAVGPLGQPVIASYWRPTGSEVPQYHLVFNQGGQWITRQISDRKTPFSLEGGGTKRIPISRPQVLVGVKAQDPGVHLVFRDRERGDRVSVISCASLQVRRCSTRDLLDISVGQWEPTFDTELWNRMGILHLFVQKVGQGDGETLEDLQPQTVNILEWTPPRAGISD